MHHKSSIVIACALLLQRASLATYSPIVVKTVTALGVQKTPDVTDVSRDGGYSVLINGNVVWLYDDTECMNQDGDQLSFVSNTAAYTAQPGDEVTTVNDFGVVQVGTNNSAILAHTTVGTGGWIPFQSDELAFNKQMNGKERVAIWPNTAPTPISTTMAFLYAPLVYVDMHPQDPSKEYQGRGMTLVTITAPSSGPIATRQGDLVIAGTEIGFGGFSSLLGRKSTDTGLDGNDNARDVYVFGVVSGGLQLARVDVNSLNVFAAFNFWNPQNMTFDSTALNTNLTDTAQIYINGTFSSGGVFFSPYFQTFIIIYFTKQVDSTFYIRFLDLTRPLNKNNNIWIAGGKKGHGIEAEDAEALVRYVWSDEQKLYKSPTGKGGFNYAGNAHPEFFSRQYFAKSLYEGSTPNDQRVNAWLGSDLVPEQAAGSDGKYLLLSWTSQKQAGIYEIQMALLEFDDVPADPDAPAPPASASVSAGQATCTSGHGPLQSVCDKVRTGAGNSALRREMVGTGIMVFMVGFLFELAGLAGIVLERLTHEAH